MANNYNRIANIYDALSRIIFQNSIKKAQQFLIDSINDDNRVLIVGGGTGWILEEISNLRKRNISVKYVESSLAMIKLAKKKNHKNLQVDFINCAIEDYETSINFDVIITAFLLDNFNEEKVPVVFKKLDAMLSQNCIWLYADFVNNKSNKKAWQQYLLKTMYLFFKLTAKIETKELIDVRPLFNTKYNLVKEEFFYSGFIQSVVYKKKVIIAVIKQYQTL